MLLTEIEWELRGDDLLISLFKVEVKVKVTKMNTFVTRTHRKKTLIISL
jgi:hypothetical protein